MKNKKAFSLLEIIIYIGLTAMILVVLLNVFWNVLNAKTYSKVSEELSYNGQIVFETFVSGVHNADDVLTAQSVFDTHPGKLVLDLTDDIIIDTYQKTVPFGDSTTDITKLRLQDGGNPAVDLTSDIVNVTNFVLTDMTRLTEKKNIKLVVTIEHLHADYDSIRDQSIEIETAASVKQQL